MISKIKNRLAAQQGFTLIELLVVIVILGILVAIAVPSYLSFKDSAAQAAAQSNVRSAIPAAEGFYQDTTKGNGTYYHNGVTGSMTLADLQAVAPGISPSVTILTVNGGKGYCLSATNGSKKAYYVGGDAGTLPTTPSVPATATVTTGYVCGDFSTWAS